jgi:long-chain acyl-CoA synthetase
MNPLLKGRRDRLLLLDSGAKVAFVWPDFVDEATKGAANAGTRIIPCGPMGRPTALLEGGEPIAEAIERDEETAIILYTSGTTGRLAGADSTGTSASTPSAIEQ